MPTAACSLLAVILFVGQGACQGPDSHGSKPIRRDFAANRCYSKGGIGIVNKKLYIVVKSANNDHNELILEPTEGKEERWKGVTVNRWQVVFVYKDNVSDADNLPEQFDLSQSVVVSFEVDKIRFYDFQQNIGCYYDRIRE